MHRIVLALAAALPLLAAIPLPPAPSRYVTDAANVIPDDREAALNAKLEQHERETTNQLIVYVDRKVPAGTTLEEMGAEAIRTWAVGQAKKDNGAILFLFIDDRQSRIEVGYGLEGTLTDAVSKRILVGLRPLLRGADYAGAVELGANRIIETITTPQPALSPPVKPAPRKAVPPQAAGVIVEDVIVYGGSIIFCLLVFIPLFYAVRAFVRGGFQLSGPDGPSGSASSSSDWPSSGSSSSGSSSSSSSSSSGGFSGGGGSGGGGGASDRW